MCEDYCEECGKLIESDEEIYSKYWGEGIYEYNYVCYDCFNKD